MIGKGITNKHPLNFLGLQNEKRIVTNIITNSENPLKALDALAEELQLYKPRHGIAYMTVPQIVRYVDGNLQKEEKEVESVNKDNAYTKLTLIVNRGKAEDAINIARRPGIRGGTILHGRGTCSECTAKLFGIEIEPEKELVIMVMPNELVDEVIDDLFEELKLDDAGNGILFTEPVWNVRGIAKS